MSVREQAYNKAVAAQSEAADPRDTRMVSANAGSGKTRVLVDRVSRILLKEVEPDQILCLTYTKAAATEMQDRLYAKLGQWSVMDKDKLRDELSKLLGEDYVNIPLARRLFAKALETPEGLKVQTIHAFCERILSRFPIEAGIMPGYEPIDDAEVALISQDVRAQILTLAMNEPDGEINQALQTLTLKMADQTLDDLFKWMSYAGEKIERWDAAGGVEDLAKTLGLKASETKDDIAEQFWQQTDKAALKSYNPTLLSGTVTDQKVAQAIVESLAETHLVAAFEIYSTIFLTAKKTLRKNPVTKKTMEATQGFFAADGNEATRVIDFLERLKSIDVLTLTHAVFTLARLYTGLYAQAKRDRRGLDFNDQILLVRNLLTKSEVSDWVQYKLDGGIEHILLDEAQDTSPEQWSIINSLSEAFLQDSPDRDPNKPRTLFAVGDEKQSIYGFQGAKPEQFLTEIQSRLTGEAKQVRMAMSFRSSQTILDVVDAFLEAQGGRLSMFNAESFPPASDIEPHAAFRADKGCVDLWPLSMKPEKGAENAPWDTTPVDAMNEGDERETLARELALKIKDWLDTGELIFDRNLGIVDNDGKPVLNNKGELLKGAVRAMNAGDILILVRTRGGRGNSLYDAIIRHLKRNAIPLAGADRIKLVDAVIVRDLLALSRFCLLPSDDLSLAEVLKSPIFGLDDMALLGLARVRDKQSLWSAVQSRDAALTQTLTLFMSLSETLSPYEFYTAVLDHVDVTGFSLRKKFFRRLGLEAREALNVFLSRAMDHQQKGVPSLQHFTRGFDNDDAEVKRDMDAAKGQVRVMTVHGSKGLEAPVVILPDTTQTPKYKDTMVALEGGYFLKPKKDNLPEALMAAHNSAEARQTQEQLRLLYVALTRAESRLVICGFQSLKNPDKPMTEGSWYDWMQRTFEGLENNTIDTPFGEGLRFGALPETAQDTEAAQAETSFTLPDWAITPAPKEHLTRKRLSPSKLLADAESAYADDPLLGLSPRLRGTIIHQLLEILPDFVPDARPIKAAQVLESFGHITPDEREGITNEVFKVLTHPDLAFLWQAGSQAEVNLAGLIDDLPDSYEFSAQIDRLCVTDTEVMIIDYKSNRDVPRTQTDIDAIYWGQMAAYRALVQKLYPEHIVRCGLVWTAHTKVMWLDDALLDDALTRIASLPTYGSETQTLL